MADGTKIEWTEATWNPITGCSLASPGCTNCYAMKLAGTRMRKHRSRAGLTTKTKAGPVWNGNLVFNPEWLDQPLRWKRPRRIFVCAHSDLFHENMPEEWIDRVFAVMALAPQHTFQVLTKRADRMREYMQRRSGKLARFMIDEYLIRGKGTGHVVRAEWPVKSLGDIDLPDDVAMRQWPLPNVWLGVSVEDQKRAEDRIPDLLDTPAAVRWISAEPLLGPIDLNCLTVSGDGEMDAVHPWSWEQEEANWVETSDTWEADFEDHFGHAPGSKRGPMHPVLDWAVIGGESGPGARPMHPEWATRLRDQCTAANVPFLFKQWGDWAPVSAIPDTDEMDEFLFHPPQSVEGPRRCKVEQCILWANAQRFDMDCWSRVHSQSRENVLDVYASGSGHMTMMRLGKRRSGRLLDGVQHDGYPESAA